MPKYKVTVTSEYEVGALAPEFAVRFVERGLRPDAATASSVAVEEIIEPFKMGDKVMVKAGSLPKVSQAAARNAAYGHASSRWYDRQYISGREFTVVGRTLADRCILQSHSGERVLYYNDNQLVRSEA